MVRGGNQDYAPPLTAVRYETDARGNKKRSRPWQNRFFNFNASSFKIRLMRELRFLDPERPNYIDLPSGLGDLFYKGLVSEQRVQVKSGGRIRWRWDAMKDRRNEVLDNANQATAGAYYMGLPSWTEDKWAQREESILRIGEEAPDLETLIARAPAATAAPFVKTANKPTLAEMRRARRGEP
jgi:phage terminase large subunit GpA-like protein